MRETLRLTPIGPYSLARSASGPGCATRRWSAGVLDMALDTEAGPARAAVRQLADGTVEAWIDAPSIEAAHDRLRALLALDLDTGPFERLAARDALLAPVASRLRGLRPLALGSAAHGLLRGVCGQWIRGRDARRIELAAVRGVGRPHGRFHLPITTDELRSLAPARLRGMGLAEGRARSLARAAAVVDLDALADLPTVEVIRRLTRIPGIGPWTAGVVCLSGLGRLDAGLVGDLGLVKALAREGSLPSVEDTARLLDRYAPYQGLASAYLLASNRVPASARAIAAFAAREVAA